MEQFTDLNKEGTTVILVTHEQEVADYAKRIITVRDGFILSDEEQVG
jgi:putative ABC transport system ATP-binding protein